MQDKQTILDRRQIQEIIPHRDAFLFVDRIIEVEYGKRAIGILDDFEKAQFEFWIGGHFPDFPVIPGATALEALPEVRAVAALGLPENRGKIAMLTGIDKWRFRQAIVPGKQIRLDAELTRMRQRFGWGHVKALTAAGEILAEGQLSFAIVDRPADLANELPTGA